MWYADWYGDLYCTGAAWVIWETGRGYRGVAGEGGGLDSRRAFGVTLSSFRATFLRMVSRWKVSLFRGRYEGSHDYRSRPGVLRCFSSGEDSWAFWFPSRGRGDVRLRCSIVSCRVLRAGQQIYLYGFVGG